MSVLTPKDWKNLTHQLKSLRGGEKSFLYKLLMQLRQHPQAFDHPERLYGKVYGRTESFNEKKLRDLSSELVRRTEDYLATTALLNNADLRQRALIRAYEQRRANDMIKSVCAEGLRRLEQRPVRSRVYLEQKLFLQEREIWTDINSIELIQQRLREIIKSTRRLFTSILLDHQTGLTETYAVALRTLPALTPYLEELVDEAKENGIFQYQLEAVRTADKILSAQEIEQRATALRPLLGQMTIEGQRDFLLALLNVCGRSRKVNGQEVAPAYFRVAQMVEEFDVLLNLPHLSSNRFSQIASAGLEVGAYEWIEYLIQKYVPLFSPEEGKELWAVTYCNYALHRGDYSKALEYLLDLGEPESDQGKLQPRLLYLLAYLGLSLDGQDYHEVLRSYLSSFERYLRRNLANNQRRLKKNLLTIRYCRKLTRLSHRAKRDRREELESILKELRSFKGEIASKKGIIRLIKNQLSPDNPGESRFTG